MYVYRVDSSVMRELKIEINALKLQAVSHNTTLLIIPASTLQAALCNYILVGNNILQLLNAVKDLLNLPPKVDL